MKKALQLINDEWNLISRTILLVIDQHGLVSGGKADKSGIGDITQSLFFSPKAPTASGWILGAGPVILVNDRDYHLIAD
ncbi:hypothetical protein PS850_00091 [Pseudomonas fluorescens]|nr:hypothetical protein PS850_00091 [Pseudomonas fluorescens]